MTVRYVPSAWDLPQSERLQLNYDMCSSEMTMTDMVQQFHDVMLIKTDRDMDDQDITDLRTKLIEEELEELYEGLDSEPDVDKARIKVADALGDLLYVIIGAALVWGIDISRVFREIHRSNMTKEPGNVRSDGKILKGPNYSPPDLSFVCRE